MSIKNAADKIDAMEWRCMNYNCTHYQTSISIRTDSWLYKFRISAKTIYKILIYWSNNMIQKDILKFVNVSRVTLSKFRKLLISKILFYFEVNPIKLGGPGSIIHVDETMINHKIKAHRGRVPRSQTWLICIVDTSFLPSRGFCCLVDNRSASHLLPIILNVVRPGSIIHTDDFKSYIKLSNISDFNHLTVCHKYHFVDPITGVHTQNVESYNNKIKKRIKAMNGLNEDGRKMFIPEFLFLDLFKDSAYIEIIKLLRIL